MYSMLLTKPPFYQTGLYRPLVHATFFFCGAPMRQMLLDLPADKPQTLDNFEIGSNDELCALLRRLSRRDAPIALSERFVYCWGELGSGKTHLLRAMAAYDQARYLNWMSSLADFSYNSAYTVTLIDDCDRLSPDQQIEAFGLFNQIRDTGGVLITSGAVPPASLSLREDLRTRLGWGLIYQVCGLSDEQKIAALTHTAQTRGFTLASGVLPYLITHFHRDMRSLSAMLDALDNYSLETKRPITLPLLRELLQREGSLEA